MTDTDRPGGIFMREWRQLDSILRGAVPDGPLAPFGRVHFVLAASYGACMGLFGVLRPDGPEWRQMAASAVKVPALFALTVLVTFPSLYVFSALLGSRLTPRDLLRLGVVLFSVLTAVLAAFGPVVAFFSATTTSYPFILLLNVALFAASGAFGVAALRRAAAAMTRRPDAPAPPEMVEEAGAGARRPRPDPGPEDDRAWSVLGVWAVVFALVGAQMGWALRPFVGAPGVEFAWLRPRGSSFFGAVLRALQALAGDL